MKRGILLAGLLLFTFSVQAQTARIAHRSHGGSNSSFNVNEDDNFGLPSKAEMHRMDSTQKATQVRRDTPQQAPVHQSPPPKAHQKKYPKKRR